MADFTVSEKITCLKREIAFRRNVYRKKVAEHRMTPAQADHEIGVMESILSDYEANPK